VHPRLLFAPTTRDTSRKGKGGERKKKRDGEGKEDADKRRSLGLVYDPFVEEKGRGEKGRDREEGQGRSDQRSRPLRSRSHTRRERERGGGSKGKEAEGREKNWKLWNTFYLVLPKPVDREKRGEKGKEKLRINRSERGKKTTNCKKMELLFRDSSSGPADAQAERLRNKGGRGGKRKEKEKRQGSEKRAKNKSLMRCETSLFLGRRDEKEKRGGGKKGEGWKNKKKRPKEKKEHHAGCHPVCRQESQSQRKERGHTEKKKEDRAASLLALTFS